MQLAMTAMFALQNRTEAYRQANRFCSLGDKAKMQEYNKIAEGYTEQHSKAYQQMSKDGRTQYTKFCKENYVY